MAVPHVVPRIWFADIRLCSLPGCQDARVPCRPSTLNTDYGMYTCDSATCLLYLLTAVSCYYQPPFKTLSGMRCPDMSALRHFRRFHDIYLAPRHRTYAFRRGVTNVVLRKYLPEASFDMSKPYSMKDIEHHVGNPLETILTLLVIPIIKWAPPQPRLPTHSTVTPPSLYQPSVFLQKLVTVSGH